ncbi:galactose-binding domain-like protein [Ochromonadaceae sp. CCMP2298]|nr:galactose-binding domain-like protein [Ochromonadaceae sp. CCMP2298]
MPPHGGGFAGATHSHDPEFPDDDWNLYSMLDESTTALNVTKPADAVGIFKPFARRLIASPELISDADAEVIVIARFTSPVNIRRLMVIGGGAEEGHHPSSLKCFINHEGVDFTSVESISAGQQFELPVNAEGLVELTTVLRAFTNVTTIAFYFAENHGGLDSTVLQYIGMQGDHTHYRREAVDAQYEVLCTGADIKQPEDNLGAAMPHTS